MSPTQRSLKQIRSEGYLAAVVEHWNPHAEIRQDLFGFIDIVALHPGNQKTLAIQCTSGSNFADRKKKVLEHPNAAKVLAAGWKIQIHGWAKHKKFRGSKAYVYELRREEIDGNERSRDQETGGSILPGPRLSRTA